MKILKLYIAAEVNIAGVDEVLHVTLCHMTPKETKKLHFDFFKPIKCNVTDIQYWGKPNLTVAILDPAELQKLQSQLHNIGYKYEDYEFVPHITLGVGDLSLKYQSLVNQAATVSTPYIRLKEF